MFQRCGFADADAKLPDADYVVVGLPFDGTASFRSGSRDGPDAIRLASFNFESYNHYYDVDLAELAICDLGNMELGADPGYAEETIKEGIALLPKAAIPIFLGGEHSITPPIVESLAEQSAQGALGVLVLDAHLDLREEYGCTRYSHACASRRILEKEGVKAYASIGIRSGCKEEFSFAKENGISYFTSLDVKEKGHRLCAGQGNGRPELRAALPVHRSGCPRSGIRAGGGQPGALWPHLLGCEESN